METDTPSPPPQFSVRPDLFKMLLFEAPSRKGWKPPILAPVLEGRSLCCALCGETNLRRVTDSLLSRAPCATHDSYRRFLEPSTALAHISDSDLNTAVKVSMDKWKVRFQRLHPERERHEAPSPRILTLIRDGLDERLRRWGDPDLRAAMNGRTPTRWSPVLRALASEAPDSVPTTSLLDFVRAAVRDTPTLSELEMLLKMERIRVAVVRVEKPETVPQRFVVSHPARRADHERPSHSL